ncbi:MAG: hypothetical protein AB1757_07645 [Acidobacteriota bacterium]
MKRLLTVGLLTMILISSLAYGQKGGWPAQVKVISSKANETVKASGDLAEGSLMEDLSWASNSSNACFPATQNEKFRGNHVLYATTIPPRSILTVTLKPDAADANMSLYGYMQGNNSFDLVPNLPRCITCEADHKWDRPWKGKVQTSERKIAFQNPTMNTYNIVIGVSAPKGTTSGKYTVEIHTQS